MCRLVAYRGPLKALSAIVIEPSHSLVAQSQEAREGKLSVNGDGVGIAWYGAKKEPGLYKDIGPAWSDSNLLSLCQHLCSPLFLAHVRASTEGETSRANCHPFTHENWSFMHNGQIGSFAALRRALEASLSDDLYAARKGSTDSELLFLLLLNAGLNLDPEAAYQRVIKQLHRAASVAGVAAFFRLTCVFSDGRKLYCFRHASDSRCPTLYASRNIAKNGLVLASEPIDNKADNWSAIPCNRIICFGPDSTINHAATVACSGG